MSHFAVRNTENALEIMSKQGRSKNLGGRSEDMRFDRGVLGHAPSINFFLNNAIWCVLVYILITFCL